MARYPTSLSECSSDTTTLLEDDAPLFPPRRRDSLTAWSEDDDYDDDDVPAPQPLFPFHLIAGCSTAERAMCQISRTITSQELQGRGRIVGLKGTLTWTVVERCGPQPAEPPPNLGGAAGFGVRAVGGPCVPSSRCSHKHHATCRNSSTRFW
jgi:hypothetical protein